MMVLYPLQIDDAEDAARAAESHAIASAVAAAAANGDAGGPAVLNQPPVAANPITTRRTVICVDDERTRVRPVTCGSLFLKHAVVGVWVCFADVCVWLLRVVRRVYHTCILI